MNLLNHRFISAAFIGFLVVSLGASQGCWIRQVDFKNFIYPWDAPEDSDSTKWYWSQIPATSKVRLIDGKHRFIDPKAPDISPALRFSFTIYGDLDGDGIEESAVALNYTTGGTMNWDYLYVFKLDHGKPRLLGRLRSGSRASGGLVRGAIKQGLLVLDFADANKRTGDCCSTGFIRVRYRLTDGHFIEEGQREYGDLEPH